MPCHLHNISSWIFHDRKPTTSAAENLEAAGRKYYLERNTKHIYLRILMFWNIRDKNKNNIFMSPAAPLSLRVRQRFDRHPCSSNFSLYITLTDHIHSKLSTDHRHKAVVAHTATLNLVESRLPKGRVRSKLFICASSLHHCQKHIIMKEDANALLKGMLGIKNVEEGTKGERYVSFQVSLRV